VERDAGLAGDTLMAAAWARAALSSVRPGPASVLIWPGAGVQEFWLLLIFVGGILAGLFLLVRGLAGYRSGGRISGIAPSRISSIAVGEVLVTGAAEPIELTLVSPLQSAPCLYYRSRVAQSGDTESEIFREERAVGFRVRDESGSVRVFPRGARFDVPDRYDEQGGTWQGDPVGLFPRTGSIFGPGPDRESQVAALLTVHDPHAGGDPFARSVPAPMLLGSAGWLAGSGSSARHYTEARIDAGDVVTVVGRVLPFADLADPAAANLLDESLVPATDPEVEADLAEARAAGILAGTPDEAWGNAAIEGFGIGKPARAPELDPRATPPPPPDGSIAVRAREAFDIAPEALVLADASDARLLVSLGAPGSVSARHERQLLLGLFGAIVAIGSAMGLALLVGGSS
jgi:hypothetical protein